MTQRKSTATKTVLRLIVLGVALSWVAADAAWADKTRVGSSRSSSSGSKVSSSSQGSSSSAGRSVVSRSSAPSTGRGSSSAVQRGGPSSRGAASTRSGERVTHGRHGGGGGRYYDGGFYYGGYYGVPYYWSPWWGGYWGWGLTIGSGYPYGYGYYAPVTYSTRQGYRMGALDLSVRPKNTEVYVDGQYVGLARRYDGFPGHLWLERGVYEVAFYKPGFATQTRTVKVMTDLILDVEIDMQPGEAIQPEMLEGVGPGEAEDLDDQAWSRPRGPRGELQGRLHLSVEPSNALIYLDGNVLGTGEELAGLRAGLILSAGTHTLEAVRRGFESVEREIVVEPGEELETALTLRPLAGGSASP